MLPPKSSGELTPCSFAETASPHNERTSRDTTCVLLSRFSTQLAQLTSQMDTVTPGSILFMSAPAGIPNAIYGGLMTMRARKLGAVGTVVDGRVRDLAEHREQGYPVFSRDLGITAGQEVCYSSEINVPVPLRSPDQPDVWINPGDIIVGDENGLACIPQNLEEEVMRLLPGLVERDRLCMEDLISGKTAEEVFRTRRGS